jgi:hypothetical protein
MLPNKKGGGIGREKGKIFMAFRKKPFTGYRHHIYNKKKLDRRGREILPRVSHTKESSGSILCHESTIFQKILRR